MNNVLNKWVMLGTIFSVCLLMASCSGKKSVVKRDASKVNTAVVHQHTNVNKLFYSGAVQPIQVNTLVSPVDGVIDKVNFSYGQIVHKNQLLVKVCSNKLQTELHDAVSSFVKSREALENSKNSFQGTEQLYQEKIIAQREYISEKTQLENNELSFLDAKFKLEQLIASIPGLDEKLRDIKLDSVSEIQSIFNKKFDEISLYADRKGIVLFPVKKTGKDNASDEVEVGSEVKKGQSIIAVGDLSSLGVEFDVGEMEINKLQPGQEVKVSTPAIPGMQLVGEVYSVAVQAKAGQGYSDSAKFPVKVKVKTIPDQYQKVLRVGMSVRIEVDLKEPSGLNIPLAAVKKHHGQAQVQVVDVKTGDKTWRTVKPGTTTMNSIHIQKGLRPNERVVIHDPSE